MGFPLNIIDLIQPLQRHLSCDASVDLYWQSLDFKNFSQHLVEIGLSLPIKQLHIDL